MPRTILFSFGFDEEIGGPRGAAHLARHIESKYGPDSASLILDEGFTGVDLDHSVPFARVGIAEKGCLTVKLSLSTPGGHSSVPPPHTGVGIMSELVVALESHPAQIHLTEENPLMGYLECVAEHGEKVDEALVTRVRAKECWTGLAEEMGERDRTLRAFMGTTQAVDVFSGGIKFNALPEVSRRLS